MTIPNTERDGRCNMDGDSALVPEMLAYYARGEEAGRLRDRQPLELLRTREILLRYLPPPPAVVLDVGGAAGIYACWLATLGYTVHLIDPVPLHLEQAQAASRTQSDHPLASISAGDARHLDRADGSADAVLLLGPLYHLVERADRVKALQEARRVLCPGGIAFAVGISRFASLLDGLRFGFLADAAFVSIVENDLRDGQHRNPTGNPAYFTTTFFHHPDDLRAEVADSDLFVEALLAVEGPAWFTASARKLVEDSVHPSSGQSKTATAHVPWPSRYEPSRGCPVLLQ